MVFDESTTVGAALAAVARGDSQERPGAGQPRTLAPEVDKAEAAPQTPKHQRPTEFEKARPRLVNAKMKSSAEQVLHECLLKHQRAASEAGKEKLKLDELKLKATKHFASDAGKKLMETLEATVQQAAELQGRKVMMDFMQKARELMAEESGEETETAVS